jgi:hypothetical protein
VASGRPRAVRQPVQFGRPHERGIPRNPFINAGAIAVTDIILSGHQPREVLGEILRFVRFTADDTAIVIDEAVAASEKRTGFRNASSLRRADHVRRANARSSRAFGTERKNSAKSATCWLGRQDSNLGMAESKSPKSH